MSDLRRVRRRRERGVVKQVFERKRDPGRVELDEVRVPVPAVPEEVDHLEVRN